MKILTILGSPRPEGNTARVLGWVEEALMDLGHDVQRLHLQDYTVGGCLGCEACKRSLETPCAQQDDGNAVFDRMVAADACIWACGLYCWGPTAQLKALMDRSYCLVMGYEGPGHESRVAGKPLGLVVTAAGPLENNLDNIPGPFLALARYLKTPPVGPLLIAGCETPEKLGDAVRQQASEYAGQVQAALGR